MLSIQLIERSDSQDKTVEQIATECPPPGWFEVFERAKPEIELVSRILTNLGSWLPLKKNLFRAFDLCPLNNVKVVILGQDPYHTVDNGHVQANGLSFSTDKCYKVQPSLKMIYTELAREYPGEFIPPNHGDLSSWADQGVLLLNTCLTVSPNQPASHMSKDGKGSFWNGFITRVFDGINDINPQCIFFLFCSYAGNFSKALSTRTIKLYASHPSPKSAYREGRDVPAFIGCNHFRMANEYLVKQGKTPIDWRLT